MTKRRNIIKRALIDAEELERAANANAVDMIIETFTPKLTDIFKEAFEDEDSEDELKESDDMDNDDELKEEDDPDIGDLEDDDELETEGTEHDLGKQPGDLSRDEGDDEEDELNEEWEAEASTGTSQKAKVSKTDGWDAVHDGDYEEDPGENEDTLPGDDYADTSGGDQKISIEDPGKGEKIPGTKVADQSGGNQKPPVEDPGKTEDSQEGDLSGRTGLKEAEDDEDFDLDDIEEDDEFVDMDVEDEDDVFEDDTQEPSSEDDEELEIPDELFGEEDDEEVSDSPEDEDGPELQFVDSLDGEGEEDDEEVGLDLEDDAPIQPEEDEEDDSYEEGLYLRKEGKFVKVSPADALKTRMSELEEENARLQKAYSAMQGQLGEAHLFNAKLAHVNKLYLSGLFSANEKLKIAETIDNCKTVKSVKSAYAEILQEVNTRNPLDGFSKLISEKRNAAKSVKKENIFESAEVRRMMNLAGIKK